MIRIVSATRMPAVDFWTFTPLGKSMRKHSHTFGGKFAIDTCTIAFKNKRGLPEVYNEAIEASKPGDILVFVHDDVFIEDPDYMTKIPAALEKSDVIGIAGNTRRVPNQAYWFSTDNNVRDTKGLSGAMRHDVIGPTNHNDERLFYGPTPAQCLLLDGCFLAIDSSKFRLQNVRFDPQFRFHFYDLDFCRSCEKAGLVMRTLPLDATHSSAGAFRSPDWNAARDLYFAKWGE